MTTGSPLHATPDAPAFTADGLAAATGGRLVRAGTAPIRGGAVDSRVVAPGNAFFALPGERTDGHRFLDAAVAAGAAALVVRTLPEPDALAMLPAGVTVIACDDPAAALRAAASSWRARWSPVVVGITGSIAKTSTKEQVAEVLAEERRVLRSAGNENNEIGLPLTLLRSGPADEALVLEMGLYHEGDIALLAAIARPSIGIVTAVRGVHLSRAGSLAAIGRGKRELIEALGPGGTAVLNADDPIVGAWSVPAGVRRLRYGFDPSAEIGADDVVPLGEAGMRFTLRLPGATVSATTPALGRHSVHNALAAAAAAHAIGMAPDAIVRGIARGCRAPHRTTLVRAGDRSILDDSYNASPDTMAAALDLLATLPGRHVAVLGEMLELGDGTAEGHRAAGRSAAARADLLIVVGGAASGIAAGARDAGMPADRIVEVADRDAALAWLAERSLPGDTILVKASRGPALDLLVEALVRCFDAPGSPA